MPRYKQWMKQESLFKREVMHWTNQSVADLHDTQDDVDWGMFRRSSDDINFFAEVVVGLIGKLVYETMHKTIIK